MKTEIRAEVLADSFCGTRLTTFLVTAPRVLLAEINTHRMLSRNAASSRAVPVPRRIEAVLSDPFTPTFWGANQPGMVAGEPISPQAVTDARTSWGFGAKAAVAAAEGLHGSGCHKQIANRVLEPYVWCSQLITATEWVNFFNLRIEEGAEPLFFELAGQMLEAMTASKPQKLRPGAWHVPFGDRMDGTLPIEQRLKISAARCARLSYERHGGDHTATSDVELADRLLNSGHLSPMEHAAQAVKPPQLYRETTVQEFGEFLVKERAHWDGKDLWWGNLRGWRQYRKIHPGENRDTMNTTSLLEKFRSVRRERGYK